MDVTRPPAVAGMFYPSEPAELEQVVGSLLAAVPQTPSLPARILVAPHAGYVYSGSTAAHAYALLARSPTPIHRVLLLGPTHRVPVRGLALPGATRLATPLGTVRVDEEGAAHAATLPGVVTRPDVHALEHSLEVHLPFLQVVLPEASVVPLAVGEVAPGVVADVLEELWDGDCAIVVSTDLSHYLPYEKARQADAATLAHIMALDEVAPDAACGARPLNGLLAWARRRGALPELLHACNSGDTAGSRDRVVGYAALALREAA